MLIIIIKHCHTKFFILIIQSKGDKSEIYIFKDNISMALIFINAKLKLKNGSNYNRGSKYAYEKFHVLSKNKKLKQDTIITMEVK